MSFFKADRSLSDDDIIKAIKSSNKLRYVVDKNGKGHWIRPVPKPIDRYAIDYCKDVPF